MLEARDVTVCHSGADPLFQGFSLTIAPGERVELTAPSGAGKTSFCRVLAGYDKPQSGSILLDGSPLPKRGVQPVQLIGQHPELAVNPRMRMKNVLAEAGSLDDKLLEALGIRTEWLTRYPHELSGGELQRFCIARALMVKPRYVIADEITTMLDAVTQAQVWQVLLEWLGRHDAGLLFVSHSPALAQRIATRTVPLP